ncbi:MAG: DUF2244 domain-containing protein [Thiolinea sp.]
MPREFIIQPNNSLSDPSRKHFLLLLAGVMFLISALLTAQGFWLVTPFMGADLLLVLYAFRLVQKHCAIVERVVINEQDLTIYHEQANNPQSWSFPLYWVNIDLRPTTHPTQNSRLLIGMQGKWVELATFLNNDERASLATAIKSAILHERQPAWAKGAAA